MQTHRLFLCKTGFKAAQHGVLGVFCLIRTELARGRKKQKCPKMPQALSCDSPATTKPRIAYYRLLRAPAASGNGNAQPARASTIPSNEGMAEEAVPAIHRGHPPLSEPLPARGTAHDATNLFCCGRYTLLESIVEWVLAHGELQEEKSPAPGWYFPRGQTILRAGGCLSHLWCIA